MVPYLELGKGGFGNLLRERTIDWNAHEDWHLFINSSFSVAKSKILLNSKKSADAESCGRALLVHHHFGHGQRGAPRLRAHGHGAALALAEQGRETIPNQSSRAWAIQQTCRSSFSAASKQFQYVQIWHAAPCFQTFSIRDSKSCMTPNSLFADFCSIYIPQICDFFVAVVGARRAFLKVLLNNRHN